MSTQHLSPMMLAIIITCILSEVLLQVSSQNLSTTVDTTIYTIMQESPTITSKTEPTSTIMSSTTEYSTGSTTSSLTTESNSITAESNRTVDTTNYTMPESPTVTSKKEPTSTIMSSTTEYSTGSTTSSLTTESNSITAESNRTASTETKSSGPTHSTSTTESTTATSAPEPIKTTITTELSSTQSAITTESSTKISITMGSTTSSSTERNPKTGESNPSSTETKSSGPTQSTSTTESATATSAAEPINTTIITEPFSTETKTSGPTQSTSTTESTTATSAPEPINTTITTEPFSRETKSSDPTQSTSTTESATATSAPEPIKTTITTEHVTTSGMVATENVTATKLPKEDAHLNQLGLNATMTVVNVTMYVTALDVNDVCATAPSLDTCPDLKKEFEIEFGKAYCEFGPEAYQKLVVKNISRWDETYETLFKVYTQEAELIIDHFVEYKYTEVLLTISEEEFINEVFGNSTIYGNFTYENSTVDIDTDFCNPVYYYPCDSSFAFRCNDDNKPECASKCEDEFHWCNKGSCNVIGDEISCECDELENSNGDYVGIQCTGVKCKTSGNMVYYGDNCELDTCSDTNTTWYIGKYCETPVHKTWLIVGLSVGCAIFVFMVILMICLSCKLFGRRKDDDFEDSVDNSIISAYEDDRYKLSSPMLSGVKNPAYLHEEESGDSIQKDRPFSYFQPSSPVDPYYSSTTFGYGNDGPGIFPPDDPNSDDETERQPTPIFASDLAQTNKKNVKKQHPKSTDKKRKGSKQTNASTKGKTTESPVFDHNDDIMYLEENTLWSPELLSKMKQPMSIKRAETRNMDAYNYPDTDY